MGMFWLIMLLLWPLIATSSDRPGCLDKCGDVSVPYPFGINESRCAMREAFKLICNHNDTTTELILGENIHVRNISVEEGTITVGIKRAYECYDKTGSLTTSMRNSYITLGNEPWPFRFSDTRNKLTVFGCNTAAVMTDARGNFGSGCISLCNESSVNITQGSSCLGSGCCQISLPKSRKNISINFVRLTNRSNGLQHSPCVYAFLADERSFDASNLSLNNYPDKLGDPNVAIEWVVKEEKCEKAQASEYACLDNTDCTYSENGNGYRCKCKEGFTGNPYLPQGCQDIDECKEPQTYQCKGTCKNTIGNYTCRCPLGMHGDGKVGCQGFRITTIASVVGAIIFGVIIGLLIFITCKWRIKEKNFTENGGKLLNHQRVRIFSEAELVKATNNYDKGHFLGEGGFGSVYRGVLADNTQVAVKKPKELNKNQLNQEFQHEIHIVSQVNHKNVVKLLGLCLETKVPLMVYEFISNGTLFQHIHDKKSGILKSWKNRLRIAAETALALDYLHSLADPPIIHRDVKSMNILLDDNYTAKVSDFGASVLISPGQTRLETKLQGTLGYLDPEYLMTGNLTEKSDVYSFGVVLVELLTGEKPSSGGEKGNILQYFILAMENNGLSQILGFEVADEGEMEEVEVVAELANRCLNRSGLKRPAMEEVAEELAKLKRLHENLWAQQNSEETEHLLGESSYSSLERAPAQEGQTIMHSAISFEIENYSYSS